MAPCSHHALVLRLSSSNGDLFRPLSSTLMLLRSSLTLMHGLEQSRQVNYKPNIHVLVQSKHEQM